MRINTQNFVNLIVVKNIVKIAVSTTILQWWNHVWTISLRLGVHKGMKQNNYKRMEINVIYLSKGNEWNGFK